MRFLCTVLDLDKHLGALSRARLKYLAKSERVKNSKFRVPKANPVTASAEVLLFKLTGFTFGSVCSKIIIR